ncbi:FmdB family zinc ribbon protein [Enterobacillus tribolii]|uniref:FmdB family zinc ribbon protein n=1 Tax=Enterobacillus tribolii TaxID=1487935 RepID=UPI000E1D5808|nr:zinc ribbon domain-containing protein [Enterobacillus tribolii]MBW7983320.1 zinc ribbon domain-containing protein [Enterobacillus tribolii]
MPIYEYACSACNHQLEKLQKMSDAPLVDCPACGNPALQKKISAAGFQLKGTGWYATDFKPGAAKTDNRKNSSENSCQNGACPARCQGESAAE